MGHGLAIAAAKAGLLHNETGLAAQAVGLSLVHSILAAFGTAPSYLRCRHSCLLPARYIQLMRRRTAPGTSLLDVPFPLTMSKPQAHKASRSRRHTMSKAPHTRIGFETLRSNPYQFRNAVSPDAHERPDRYSVLRAVVSFRT